jgi:hypothetical protein
MDAENPTPEQSDNGAEPPDAAKVIGQIVLTVNATGALNIGGTFTDPQQIAETLSRALRFMDRELLAKRVAQELNPPVRLAQPGAIGGQPLPTRRWPIR